MPMMMRSRLRIGMNMHRPRPELLCSDAGEVYRCRAVHAGSLSGVMVEGVGGDDADALRFPSVFWWRGDIVVVGMGGHGGGGGLDVVLEG